MNWAEKDLIGVVGASLGDELSLLSHTMYQSNGFRKLTPPQNRWLIVLIGGKNKADDFVGELTFSNHLINALCEKRAFALASKSARRPNHTPQSGRTCECGHPPLHLIGVVFVPDLRYTPINCGKQPGWSIPLDWLVDLLYRSTLGRE